ncbi:protein hunchback [Drosophila yakuba]|uniref:Protein hunchback n=2 Tax=Drosophila yakuba TaxID=7245 RepID=HUNB_DROYA|nr:protein hunchback [Drosophila yakuba]XP_039231608.1 protein hunchback [Drosophila yakuba]O62541.2 RecName: Full=Protein hunchback [Drosophila yakuba]EDW96551.1 hunchback [Drosophila yakuba]
MQNWETTATTNYEQHNAWYNSMFAANIKQEPGHHLDGNSVASSPRQSPIPSTNHLEQFLKQQQQQQHQQQPMDTLCAMTPSPSQNDQNSLQHYDASLQQQLLQQQQYQQHFQAAQQQHHHHHHLMGGFNPLTPPGLPNPMQHFYGGNLRPSPQPTPTSASTVAPVAVATGSSEKLQALTPPMDVTPPKSPAKSSQSNIEPEKEHDQMSNSSEDMKYMAESEDDDTNIRMPIYNSHGKMKNYKCKTCGVVAITKVDFWAHTRTHMKPDKILQCPKCPFVTEFKHHLEYHIRKHKNQKPFQCDKCSYTCVNKSMLNSHRKSHSSVYQYRCADCDYATKYCHSFKLHLRKYGHKPGMVLDEDGTPNPSLVIDVYGTRRGPKSKNGGPIASGGSGSGSRKPNVAAVAPQQQQSQPAQPATSQLSAALQGFPLVQSNSAPPAASPVLPLPASPAKSVASVEQTPSLPSPANLLPPLASLLQQNRNMAFFPYWNLNLQMLAAQQQAAVLAQLSPRMREQLQQQNQQQSDNEEEEQDDEYERKSVDSAMDLSQGTPVKEDDQHQQQQQPQQPLAMNLKVEEEATPLMSSSNASRRKGRVLKLDTLLQLRSEAMTSPEQLKVPSTPMPTASSPIAGRKPMPEDHCSGTSSADESMETAHVPQANTSASSTASSSGNSSNASSNGNSSSNSSSNGTSSAAAAPASGTPAAAGAIYECKYCDIFFKDAVLYTIHMGYHSCDDVFKCNMCGEKCDGPVGLFVHMARNAHS